MNDPRYEATRCPICKHENGEHALSCPTRWYDAPNTDALVARSDADALDALTRALDTPARPSYTPLVKPDLDDYSGFAR